MKFVLTGMLPLEEECIVRVLYFVRTTYRSVRYGRYDAAVPCAG